MVLFDIIFIFSNVSLLCQFISSSCYQYQLQSGSLIIHSMASIANSLVSRNIYLLAASFSFTDSVFSTTLPQTSFYMIPIFHMATREDRYISLISYMNRLPKKKKKKKKACFYHHSDQDVVPNRENSVRLILRTSRRAPYSEETLYGDTWITSVNDKQC